LAQFDSLVLAPPFPSDFATPERGAHIIEAKESQQCIFQAEQNINKNCLTNKHPPPVYFTSYLLVAICLYRKFYYFIEP